MRTWPYFDCFTNRGGFGLWLFGRGFIVTGEDLLFSERYGYRKHIPLGFGWRVRLLKAH